MRVITAQVMDGKVELPAECKDGTTVAFLAPDPEAAFHLAPEQEDELATALQQVRCGDYTSMAVICSPS